jgi:hypothetical protein
MEVVQGQAQAQGVASVLERNKGDITLLQCTGDSDGLWARRGPRSDVTERGGLHPTCRICLYLAWQRGPGARPLKCVNDLE